jgi:hypothetical protein
MLTLPLGSGKMLDFVSSYLNLKLLSLKMMGDYRSWKTLTRGLDKDFPTPQGES